MAALILLLTMSYRSGTVTHQDGEIAFSIQWRSVNACGFEAQALTGGDCPGVLSAHWNHHRLLYATYGKRGVTFHRISP